MPTNRRPRAARGAAGRPPARRGRDGPPRVSRRARPRPGDRVRGGRLSRRAGHPRPVRGRRVRRGLCTLRPRVPLHQRGGIVHPRGRGSGPRIARAGLRGRSPLSPAHADGTGRMHDDAGARRPRGALHGRQDPRRGRRLPPGVPGAARAGYLREVQGRRARSHGPLTRTTDRGDARLGARRRQPLISGSQRERCPNRNAALRKAARFETSTSSRGPAPSLS